MEIPARFYRYGIAPEKDILDTAGPDCYDGVVLPAHLVVDQKDSLSKWLVEKNHYFDPMTHVFFLEDCEIFNSKGEFKRPYEKLRTRYGPPYSTISNAHVKLKAIDIINIPDKKKEFIDSITNIIDFQENFVKQSYFDNEIDELNKLAKEEGFEENLIPPPDDIDIHPDFIVLPYVSFDSMDTAEYYLNKLIWDEFDKSYSTRPIYAMISTYSNCIDLGRLASDLRGKVDGVLLWFTDIDEYNSDVEELLNVRRAILSLSNDGFQVRMHSGGPFYMGLKQDGLLSVAGGITYGEVRKASQVQGGPLPQRYFIPQLLRVYSKGDAEFILNLIPLECKEPCCNRFLKANDNFFTKLFPGDPATTFGPMTEIKLHYLYNFKKTMQKIWENGYQEGIEHLESNYNELKDVLFDGMFEHLDVWAKTYSYKIK